MKRLLKIVGWTFLLMLFLSSAIAGIAWWKKESILRVMVDELNKNLLVPVEVDQMELSLEHFPSVAIRFHKVFIADPRQPSDTLLFVEKLDAASNLKNWIRGNYRINNLYAHFGKVEIRQYSDESWNYQAVYSASSDKSSNRNIELKGLRAEQLKVYYFQPKEKIKLLTDLRQIDLQGDLMNFENVTIELKHKAFSLDLNQYSIKSLEGAIKLNENKGLWAGSWQHSNGELAFQEKDQSWSFALSSKNVLELANWFHTEIPIELIALDGSWNAKGTWFKSAGKAEIEWTGKNIDLNWKGYPPMELDLAGIWKMEKDSTFLILTKGDAKADEYTLSALGTIRLDGMAKSAALTGILSVNDLSEFSKYSDSAPTNVEGKLDASFTYKGVLEINALKNGLLSDIVLEKVGFDYDGLEIRKAKGNITQKGNVWQLENLLVEIDKQEVFANGAVEFSESEMKAPSAQLKLRMTSLDLSKWISGAKSKQFNLPDIELDVILDADKFRLNNLNLSQLKISFRSDKQGVKVDKLYAEGLGGELKGQLSFMKSEASFQLQSEGEFENISIDKLLNAFDNFGQTVLNSDHIIGRVSSNFNLRMELDANAQINLNKLEVEGNLKLVNAELIGFAPLEALSIFAQRDELNHLKMKEHIQPIEIHDGAVWLPLTSIRTNAFELKLSGEHRFTNWIDYTVQLPIESLIKKGKKSKGEFDDWIVEVQERQQPGIYVKIVGDMNNPDIQWDREATQNGLKQEWREKANPFKKDTTTLPLKPSGGIQFEWEEDEG